LRLSVSASSAPPRFSIQVTKHSKDEGFKQLPEVFFECARKLPVKRSDAEDAETRRLD
jgi:hypothetical protein